MQTLKNDSSELMYKTQIVTDVENNLMVMGRGGINWEIGNDITQYYI